LCIPVVPIPMALANNDDIRKPDLIAIARRLIG
jgi:hypothetical protein